MARKIVVEIVGDSASLERSFQRASHSATQFDKNVTHAARGAIAGSGAFEHLGRSLAFASGGFVAFASVTEFLRSSVDAAREAATGHRSLVAQMKASSQSFAANKDFVDKASQSVAKFGFTAEDSEAALTVLERATGKISKAVQLQGVAANIARAKNISLSQAALILGKAYDGQTTSLKRLGVEIPKGVKGMDAIRIAAQKFAGQARANTTESQRFAATIHNTEMIVGTALLPVLNKLLTHIGAWLQKMNETGRLQRDVNQVVKTATGLFTDLKAAVAPLVTGFKALGTAVGGTKNELELLVAAFAAFKFSKIIGSLGLLAGGMGGIGTKAKAARTEVGLLQLALARIPAFIPVTIAFEVIMHRKQIEAVVKHIVQSVTTAGAGQITGNVPFSKDPSDTRPDTSGRVPGVHFNIPGGPDLVGVVNARGNIASVAPAIPGSVRGRGNAPLSAAQKLQAALNQSPNDIGLLRQKEAFDQKQIAFLNKLHSEGILSNKKWLDETGQFWSDFHSTADQVASIEAKGAAALKRARDKILAAWKKRLREDIPAHVGETVSYNGPNFEVHLPGRVGGGGMFGAQSYNTPLALQVAAAKAAALNDQAGLNRAAQAAKTAAMRAIHSGKLGLEAMREAWDIVAQANSTIGTSITKTATAVSSRVLTAGLGLNRDTRKALEARMALAGAFSGHVPTSMGVLGQSVHVGTIVLPNVTDPHSFADTLGKLGRTKPVQTTGHNAGRSRALP